MKTTSTINLPDTFNQPISLRPVSHNTLAIEDNNQSLLLSLSNQQQPLITAANESDLPDRIPAHLPAAALDYLFSCNPRLPNITIAPTIAERLSRTTLIHEHDDTGTAISYRAGLYQDRTLWHWQKNDQVIPEIWTSNDKGIVHPLRQEQPEGIVYERYDYQSDLTVSFRTIDPEQDLELFHQWMNQPRVAEFWEMDQSRDKLRNYIHSLLQDKRTWPVIGCFNGEPFGYIEIYWAMEDRIAPYYDCQPWDRGFHVLVGNTDYLGKRYSLSWSKSMTHFLFLDDPRTNCLVGEPRADNQRLIKLTGPAGWSFVKEFDFPHKRAALIDCRRENFFGVVQL